MANKILDEKLAPYLSPTAYCDSDNPAIRRLAEKVTAGCRGDREKIAALFDYIKNNYRYAFGDWRLKASQSIDKKTGMCTTKSNLLVACLRSLAIPAGFEVLEIKGREIFGLFTRVAFLKNKISEKSIHIYVKVYLGGRFVSLDPSLDRRLIKGIIRFGYKPEALLSWDGKSDHLNFIPPDKIIRDLGFFSSIDDYHAKPRRAARSLFLAVSRLVMAYYRLGGRFNNY